MHKHTAEVRRYAKVTLITFGVLVWQLTVALTYGSLALFSDTIHVGSDLTTTIGSLVVALLVVNLNEEKEARLRKIFAFGGIILLSLGAFYVLYEAHERLLAPIYNPNWWVLAAAIGGLIGNFLAHRILHEIPCGESNHTHRVLSAHVLSDMLLSGVVIVGISLTLILGWVGIDPVLSVGVAGYMLFLSGRLYNEVQSGHVHHH